MSSPKPTSKLIELAVAVAVGLVLGWLLFSGSVRLFGVGGVVQYAQWYFRGPIDISTANSLSASGGTETSIISAAGNWIGGIVTSAVTTLTGTTRITTPIAAGGKLVLTGTATTSISGAQVCANTYVEWMAGQANASATLPSSAALTCLTTNGDELGPLIWHNTGVNAASSTIFAAGASTTLVYENASSSLGVLLTSLPGQTYATLQFVETSSTDPNSGVTVLINQFK